MTMIRVSDQIAGLLEYAKSTGQETDLSEIAHQTGITYQALANLVQGKVSNPRLNTLLALCQYFGISLDYFNCESEAACREYLYVHLASQSSLINEIEQASAPLSAKGQRNVLAIMAWRTPRS
jgi:transcriptional regulator with XRE-family HTH domain